MTQSTEIALVSGCDKMFRSFQARIANRIKVPFAIRVFGDRNYLFGRGQPNIEIRVNDKAGLAAISGLDEVRICEAYMEGSLDVIGDMLGFISLRSALTDRHPLHRLWQRIAPFFTGSEHADRGAIASHYNFDNEFYFTFMDATRCYSQAVFERDDEPLETAQCRKLDFAIEACGLKAGDHVLDVGGGWGAFSEHAGRRGIKVTSLTIAHNSEQYLNDLISRLQLPCKVLNQHFLSHETTEPYDAIVILGVMEHLPDYPAVLQKFQQLLKPGGYVYMDASATREKYSKPTFISRYVFPGDHTLFCLHDFLASAAKTPLEVVAIHNDRHSYFLTCKAWAERLESARSEVISRWGEQLYRRFRIYLWGSAYAFLDYKADAFRVVLQRPSN